MTESEHKRVHLWITGRVQGVFFRAHTRDQARQLGLSGWVRNREDGSVEALAEGPEAALRQLVAWCHEGSPGSVVREVREKWAGASGELVGFSIRY
jgi:acylphosphatase